MYRNASQKKWNGGFTLIELMITMVIISIIASIAIPSYQSYISRARRSSATSGLQLAAQMLERNMTTNNCYNYKTPNDCAMQSGTQLTLPTGMSVAPSEGTAMYDVNFQSLTSTAYTLQAIPKAGSPQVKDVCGTLTLNQAGVKGLSGQAAGQTVASCWGG